MKKNYFVYTLIVYAFIVNISAFSQSPQRTVNFSSTLAGTSNYSSITGALIGAPSGITIWVAAGNYNEAEIIVPAGITLIGGFPSTTTSYSDRIYPGMATNSQKSILCGNSEHRVAKVYGIMDGFVITKGYAYDATEINPMNAAGGGVFIDGGIVQNCIIQNNIAAQVAPTVASIPDNFIAGIGDIYCSDGTILNPTYKLNQATGQIEANLAGGIPAGKIVQGIVYHMDFTQSTQKIHIMAKVSNSALQPWSNPTFDVPGITNCSTDLVANADFNGKANTDSAIAYIPRYIAEKGNQWWQPTVSYNGLKYPYEYNIPSGTKGQWYLPAAGEMYKIIEVAPQMDACARDILGWISGTNASMFPNGVYWTSTEYNSSNVWVVNLYSFPSSWYLDTVSKTQGGYSTPVTTKILTTK